MSGMITIYYYTAWDGFAWQGCDEATAKSLQGYMEATKTLPRSSAEEPPFGGAVPCKINGEIGVAVYRYLTRKKGDLSGRDSLYIALAFIPLAVGCVDFAKLLELPQLATPQSGELRPEGIRVDECGLRIADANEEPGYWLERDIADTEYRVLSGRKGLRKLSELFFSKYAQLGFLNAVFRSESGIDAIVSSQSYRVYPEVADVAATSEGVRDARRARGGVLERNHEAVMAMGVALAQLRKWSERQRDYVGLREYHDEKEQELRDDDERMMKVSAYAKELKDALARLRNSESVSRRTVEGWADLAGRVSSLPVLDHQLYVQALSLSLELMRSSASCLGSRDGDEAAKRAETARAQTEEILRRCKSDAERAKREADREVERLKGEVKGLEARLKKTQTELRECKENDGLRGDLAFAFQKSGRVSKSSPSLLDWILRIIIMGSGLVLAVVMFLLVKNTWFANRGPNRSRTRSAGMVRRVDGLMGTSVVSVATAVNERNRKENVMTNAVDAEARDDVTTNVGNGTVRKADGKVVKRNAPPSNGVEAKKRAPDAEIENEH